MQRMTMILSYNSLTLLIQFLLMVTKPTVILKGYYISDLYRHIIIETADGIIQSNSLEQYGQESADRVILGQ